ncbi:hypothetical protein EON63_09640 [archaeon]|nr:MAG: hypothetical protein EON63_09640 [archaeon]
MLVWQLSYTYIAIPYTPYTMLHAPYTKPIHTSLTFVSACDALLTDQSVLHLVVSLGQSGVWSVWEVVCGVLGNLVYDVWYMMHGICHMMISRG